MWLDVNHQNKRGLTHVASFFLWLRTKIEFAFRASLASIPFRFGNHDKRVYYTAGVEFCAGKATTTLVWTHLLTKSYALLLPPSTNGGNHYLTASVAAQATEGLAYKTAKISFGMLVLGLTCFLIHRYLLWTHHLRFHP